jgi:hypothetical protein
VSADFRAAVQENGAVAVEEDITVAFGNFGFTYGFREIPLRKGERLQVLGVSSAARLSAPARRPTSSPADPRERSASVSSTGASASSGASRRRTSRGRSRSATA